MTSYKEQIEEYIIDHVSDTHCSHSDLIDEVEYCFNNKDSHHVGDFERLLKDSCIGALDLKELADNTWNKYCREV